MAKTVSSAPALKSQDGRDSFNFQVLLFWLTCVWLAFDYPISPRKLKLHDSCGI